MSLSSLCSSCLWNEQCKYTGNWKKIDGGSVLRPTLIYKYIGLESNRTWISYREASGKMEIKLLSHEEKIPFLKRSKLLKAWGTRRAEH